MTAILGHNFIGGASAAGTLFLQSLDAASGEALPYRFVQATPEEVDAAAEAAASAYPHYRQLPASRRAEFLDTIAAELDALDADFVAIVCRETALPATRIQGERSRTSGQLRLFAEVLRRGDFHGARIDRARPERKPLPRVDLRQCRIGLGPVAVFGASNFPWRSPPPAAIPPRPGRRLPGGVQGAQRTHGHRRTGRRGDPPRGRAHRHAGGRVQHDLRRRSRGAAGPPPRDPGGRLHRFAEGRPRPLRHGGRPGAADPGVRRDEQHQPGGAAAGGAEEARRGRGRRTECLGGARLRPVLYQSRAGHRHPLCAILGVPRTLRRPHGRPAGADHAQRRHAGQL